MQSRNNCAELTAVLRLAAWLSRRAELGECTAVERLAWRNLIDRLIHRSIDVGACSEVADPKADGFGHAYGFVFKRLVAELQAPIVPILLNTYYPPNQPAPAPC